MTALIGVGTKSDRPVISALYACRVALDHLRHVVGAKGYSRRHRLPLNARGREERQRSNQQIFSDAVRAPTIYSADGVVQPVPAESLAFERRSTPLLERMSLCGV